MRTEKLASGVSTADEEHSPVDTQQKPSEVITTTIRASKQDSLDRPDPRENQHVRSASPRRLIKQVALAESPPEDEPPHSFYRGVHCDKKSHAPSNY